MHGWSARAHPHAGKTVLGIVIVCLTRQYFFCSFHVLSIFFLSMFLDDVRAMHIQMIESPLCDAAVTFQFKTTRVHWHIISQPDRKKAT